MDESIRYGLGFLSRDEVDDQEEAVQEGRGAAVEKNFVVVDFVWSLLLYVLLLEH